MKSLKEYSDEIFNFLKEAAPQQPATPPAVPATDWAALSKEIETFKKTLSRVGFASINDFRQSMQLGSPLPQPPPAPSQPTP